MTAAPRRTGFLRRFARDRRAMGAVEFALIAPVLFVIYLGGSELSIALTVDRKVKRAASTVNDLVTQTPALNSGDFQGITNIAKSILAPYDLKPLSIRVSSVSIDANGITKVAGSCGSGSLPALAKGSAFALPADFAGLKNWQVIVTQTSYAYVPVTGGSVMKPFNMGGVSYLNPRNTGTVEFKGC